MHISCPHCNAAYEVGPMIKNAMLVCHRCHTEFSPDSELIEQQKKIESEATDQSLPLFEQIKPKHINEEAGPVDDLSSEDVSTTPVPAFLKGEREKTPTKSDASDAIEEKPDLKATDQSDDSDIKASDIESSGIEEVQIPLQELKESAEDELLDATSHKTPKEPDAEALPPARKRVVIWPWLIAILLIISGTGFWFKQNVWLDDPWVRSLLINIHLPVEVRNRDWSIIPGSVQGHWLKRDDGSQILTIQGRVENRLYCELPPPQILVQFFDDTGITEKLGEKLMPITEPPSMEQIKHAPFAIPDIDRVPVEDQGGRGFFLVIDSLPEHTADFTLSPVANRKH
ncbi:MAG: hypothetical protein R8K54_03305 [Mariprofundaceae bacterium]